MTSDPQIVVSAEVWERQMGVVMDRMEQMEAALQRRDNTERDDQHSLHDLDRRLSVLEEIVRGLRGRLESIDKHLSTLVWLVVAGLVGGILNWILKGGLNG